MNSLSAVRRHTRSWRKAMKAVRVCAVVALGALSDGRVHAGLGDAERSATWSSSMTAINEGRRSTRTCEISRR